MRLAYGHEHASRQAPFPGAAVERLRDHVDGTVEVRVRHDDDEVLGASESLDALSGVRGSPVDGPGDRRGSDEGDGADSWVIADRLDDLASPVDEIDDSRGQIALLQQLDHPSLRQRHLLGRLDEKRVPGRDREGEKPERHHGGKVERRDRRADSHRLPDHAAVDPGGDVLETVAHHERWGSAGDLDTLDAAPDASPGFIERLAVLGRDDARELLEVFLEKRLEFEEHSSARHRRRVAPGGEGLPGRGDRGVDVLRGRERRSRDDLA